MFKNLYKQDTVDSNDLTQRDVLDFYFMSFFNAWIDYQNLYGREKLFKVAFCPNTIEEIDGIEQFFHDYPNGFRLHVIRSPLGWWASEKTYGSKEKKAENYIGRWKTQAKSAVRLREKYSKKYILVNFTNLLKNPQETMEKICERTNLRYQSILTLPTFNNIPITPNSSYEDIEGKGIKTEPLTKWRRILNEKEKNFVESETEFLKRKVVKLCLNST